MSAYVYRAYDRAGSLLYVGVTSNIDVRRSQHEQNSGWWMFHERIEHDEFATRAEALVEEKRLIQELHPRWNRRDRVPGQPEIEARYRLEKRIWRDLSALNRKRSGLLRKLEVVEEDISILTLAIEAMADEAAAGIPLHALGTPQEEAS